MPFVTEEIYQMLPIKDSESIMISNYPKYEEKYVFDKEENLVNTKIEFIKNFRNIKAENNITKEAKVLLNIHDEIIIKMLKLQDSLIDEPMNINSYSCKVNEIEATIYYEKVITEEEKALKEKQINELKSSIERRKKLLANENYVAKAPESLVQKERDTLKEEEELLLSLET